MTESKVDLLAVIAKHRDAHKSLSETDAYSAQEYPRLAAAYDAVAELIEAAQPFRKDPNPCGRGDHFTDGLFVTLGQIRRLDSAMETLGAPKLCHCGNLNNPHSMGVPGCHYYGKCDVCRKPFGGPAYGFPDVLCKSCNDKAALSACTPAKSEGR